ncbi:MAG TPA: PadR family transcriptional regulator [Kiloniellales bacterium]|nr:PadR family transcriptional regulator [Kiloniellales bacterium]
MDARTLCLAALSLGEASGYEIKKTLDEPPFHHFQDTGFGSIYPALNRLAREGLVSSSEQAQERRPDKKVYSLTPEGRERLQEALLQPPRPDRVKSDFLFLLFMARLMPREHLAKVIDQRIEDIDAKLAHMEECEHEVSERGHRFVFELGRSYYRFLRGFLLHNKDWLLDENTPADPARLVAG